MSKTYYVARREFLATVLTKGFLLGILLPPIIGGLALTLVPLLMNAVAPKTAGTIAVIDQSGLVAESLKTALDADAFKSRRAKKMQRATEKVQKATGVAVPADDRTKKLASAAMDAGAATLTVEILPQGTNVDEAKKPLMDTNVRDNETGNGRQRVALVVIPAGAVRSWRPPFDPELMPSQSLGASFGLPLGSGGDDAPQFDHYQIFTAPKLDIEVTQDISDQVDTAIVNARLKNAVLDPASVRALTLNPVTDTKVVTHEGDRSDNGVAAMMIPGAFLVLLWVSVLVGGQGLLLSTIEEKSSRVMEVLLSAVSPIELMVGKILGQMAVASLILGLYSFTGIGALIVFSMSHLLDPMVLVYTLIYFVIAFFLMASMMAAVGSVVNDIREAQALMQPFMIVMVIPMMLWLPISRNPNALWAQIVSLIPPVSPFVMVIRLAGSEPIPTWQIPASMVIGIGAMCFMGWATAKVFRIGVLMYGKPPNLKTLIRWVRMA